MNKIRVIDLLIKVANGESVPEVIEYQGRKYGLIDYGKIKIYLDKDEPHEGLKFSTQNLHDNVEIIEEDKQIEIIEENKPIEKITIKPNKVYKSTIVNKINEIVDKVNELERGRK